MADRLKLLRLRIAILRCKAGIVFNEAIIKVCMKALVAIKRKEGV